MTENNHRYTIDLTKLINERITYKENIKVLGNESWKIKTKIGDTQKKLANVEKDIDNMVINFNKNKK